MSRRNVPRQAEVKNQLTAERGEKGILVRAERTGKAVKVFIEESRKAEESSAAAAGAFHLTC
jgi:hypothetical protein